MMFELFRRVRGDKGFSIRSPLRNAATDMARIGSIAAAIEAALSAAEAEVTGLSARLSDVTDRAAATLGNDSDEYLGREALDNRHHDLFSSEIVSAEGRLKELHAQIGHFKFMKTVLATRFPDFKPPDAPTSAT
jgi:hypothetical protein